MNREEGRLGPSRYSSLACGLLLSALLAACQFNPSGIPGGTVDAGNHQNHNANVNTNENQSSNTNNSNQNTTPICGDGVVDSGETCDDGDGLNTDGCPDGPGGTCRQAFCGDGFLWAGHEGCDDGNKTDGDGCSAACMLESCGNGVVDEGEACDDGNGVNTDACPDGPGGTCQHAFCGDGFVWAGNETCDDGNTDPCAGQCAVDCSRPGPVCGDGVLECHEACDQGDFGGATCDSVTNGAEPYGDLGCTNTCGYDTQGCFSSSTCSSHGECPVGQQCDPGVGCVAVGNTCDDSPFALTSSGVYSHTLENLTNDYNGGGALGGLDCPGLLFDDSEGADRVYQIPVSTGDYVTVWVEPTDWWNATVYLTNTCPVTSCIYGRDWAEYDPAPERIDYVASSAGTVYLVVDGNDGSGSYDLHVHRGSASDWRNVQHEGDIILNELLADPDGSDRNNVCEWLEILNTQSVALNLHGVEISSPDGSFTIDTPLMIEPGGYMIMAHYAEIEHASYHNCGVPWVSWAYWSSDFNLYYWDPCLIEIWKGATLVDDIDYQNGWPFSDGRSMYLCTNWQTASDNDSSGNWLETPADAQYSYSFGGYANYATPLEANPGSCN
jgi:cysteine-rich repeat protein